MDGPGSSRLRALITAAAREERLPDGGTIHALADRDIPAIARQTGESPWLVADVALAMDVLPARYLRNLGAFGLAGQIRLHRGTAAMVGLGGLGGLVLESLARLGVGRILAADHDVFEDSNLNRQILATTLTHGIAKATAAQDRSQLVNPLVHVDGRKEKLDREGMDLLLEDADVVLDCLGGLAGRRDLEMSARQAGLPLVTGAVAGWSGYVAVVMPGGVGPARFMGEGPASEDSLGTQPPAIYTAASIMAGEASRLLAQGECGLAGRALFFDLSRQTWDTVTLD